MTSEKQPVPKASKAPQTPLPKDWYVETDHMFRELIQKLSMGLKSTLTDEQRKDIDISLRRVRSERVRVMKSEEF